MKIVDLKVIPFRAPRRPVRNGKLLPETTAIQTLTKIITDEGAEGYYFGGRGHGDRDGMSRDQRAALEGRIQTLENGYDALDGANALVIFTDWQEFRNPDFEAIVARLKEPVIFDGRNLYEPALVRKAGIQYHSVGRAPVLRQTEKLGA